MNNLQNIYKKLKIDIPTLNGVMIEKYVEPNFIDKQFILWHDRNEKLHSFNGFPALIMKQSTGRVYSMAWYKHGEKIKITQIDYKSETEIIGEKIKNKNFEERARNENKKRN